MKKFYLLATGLLLSVVVNSQVVDINLLKQHVYTLASDSLMGRGFGTRGGRFAADYIEKQFMDAGVMPWNGNYRHEFIHTSMMMKTEGCNIVGWVEGSDPNLKDEFIVMGAHYDHVAYKISGETKVVYNGADDNASGTASVIELGRWLVKNKHLLKRSVILVAFDGEESGLIGSSYMVRNRQIPIEKVKIMFSLDMVGMLSKYGGIDLIGNKTLKDGKQIFDDLANKHNLNIKDQGRRVEAQTDTQPFGKEGIPAIHVFTSTVSPYHKPEDDPNLLDYEGMVTINNFLADVLTEFSGKEEVLKPDKIFIAEVKGKWYIPSFGIRIGAGNSSHNYKDDYFIGKEILAAQAGLYMQIKLGKRFSLQPEVLYRTVGSEHANGQLRTHEVTVPVNLRVKLNSNRISLMSPDLFVMAGPYYSYKFYGKVGKNEMDFSNTFQQDEKGIQYAIGIEVSKVLLISSVQQSFTSIDKAIKVMPSYYSFTVGFRF